VLWERLTPAREVVSSRHRIPKNTAYEGQLSARELTLSLGKFSYCKRLLLAGFAEWLAKLTVRYC